MDFLSEEEIKNSVSKQLKVVIEDISRQEIRELVKNTLEADDVTWLIKTAVEWKLQDVSKIAEWYFAGTQWRTRISRSVSDYIDSHWFIPTSLSPVEKKVVVDEIILSVKSELEKIVEQCFIQNANIISKVNELVVKSNTLYETQKVIDKLRELGFHSMADTMKFDLDNRNPYSELVS